MAEKMDKLGRRIKSNKRNVRYGHCYMCGKEHQGHMAVRGQAVAYQTKAGARGSKGQEYLWSKSRAMCRDCAANWIDHIEAFFNGRN